MNFEKPARTDLGQDFYVAFLLFIWRYILGMTILLILFFDIKKFDFIFHKYNKFMCRRQEIFFVRYSLILIAAPFYDW